MRALIFILPLLALAAPLSAEPGLPDDAAIGRALDEHPSVPAARARTEAARARANGLRAGPHEFTFSGSYIRRSVDREGKFDEYDAQVSRALRLPGKGRLDREIGAFGVEAAENLAEDARHQAALLLAGHWFDWLSASAQARVDAAAVTNYAAALKAIKRRHELRDAAQLDVDQASAALAAARLAAEGPVMAGPWSWCVLRPAAIYGPGRGAHESIRIGRWRIAGDGSNYTSRIHVDDLAALAAAAVACSFSRHLRRRWSRSPRRWRSRWRRWSAAESRRSRWARQRAHAPRCATACALELQATAPAVAVTALRPWRLTWTSWTKQPRTARDRRRSCRDSRP